MSELAFRRVVLGTNAQGQSSVTIDGPIEDLGHSSRLVWRSSSIPADNAGTADAARPFATDLLHDGGSNFMLVEVPPGVPRYMHATNTLDYLVVLRGQLVLELETGEVVLSAGDFIVDRGVKHSWRNDTAESAVMACITIPAHPVGSGRTI